MKSYLLSRNSVKIHFGDFMRTIFFNQHSGKVFCRLKINTISEVKHPGIYIGIDELGTEWFMHNHYDTGRPSFITRQQFSKGQRLIQILVYTKKSYLQIIEGGLRQIVDRKTYSAFWYNCQHFVNIATKNENFSEDVKKWAGITATALILLGFVTNSKG